MGGGSSSAAVTEDKPFSFSKWTLNEYKDGEKFDGFAPFFAKKEPVPVAASAAINLKDDLGIIDPMDETKDTGKDKNKMNVTDDKTAKTDKFKKKQNKTDSYKAPKSDGFMNVVT